MTETNRLLIVTTNVGEYKKVGYRTGLWLAELTHFWDVADEAGFEMDIVSPKGGYVPIDPESLITTELGASIGLKGSVHKHYEDRAFMDRLQTTRAVSEVDPSRYDAIYLTGGHGVMFDFKSPALAELTAAFHDAGKLVSAVCHGPAGLLEVKLQGGKYLLDGKKVTGFSWKEEQLVKRDRAVPFSLEEELMNRGAQYDVAAVPFLPHVIEDGALITGQNPASARGVGEAVVRRLRAR
ncbi:MAG TPA: type 1 glutamine amidotransferase domain-containing protein [Polyangiales bacterium]|nr:type 1 glutamine amidotransferase domain-containing protein [Polyangiales bacterium]